MTVFNRIAMYIYNIINFPLVIISYVYGKFIPKKKYADWLLPKSRILEKFEYDVIKSFPGMQEERIKIMEKQLEKAKDFQEQIREFVKQTTGTDLPF